MPEIFFDITDVLLLQNHTCPKLSYLSDLVACLRDCLPAVILAGISSQRRALPRRRNAGRGIQVRAYS